MSHTRTYARTVPGVIYMSVGNCKVWDDLPDLDALGHPRDADCHTLFYPRLITVIANEPCVGLVGWSLCLYAEGVTSCVGWLRNYDLRGLE